MMTKQLPIAFLGGLQPASIFGCQYHTVQVEASVRAALE
jgi:hypothetical protein